MENKKEQISKNQISILNLIIILLKNKKPLFFNFLFVSIVSIIISLLITKWYKADTLFILPESKAPSSLSNIVGSLPIDFGYSESQEGEKFITLLKSRKTIDALIDTFKLDSVFDHYEYRFQLREYVTEDIISFEIYDDGSIQLSVIFPDDTLRPALMANFLVRKIDQLHKQLESQQAHFQRVFLDEQYVKITSELSQIEDSLALFQKEYSVLDISEQLKGVINLISQLQFEKIQTEISIKVLEKYYSQDFAEINRLKSKDKILKQKISSLFAKSDNAGIIKSINEIPELSLQYVRLLREIKIKEKILEFLIPQLEQAKVEEVKNTPSVLVIDQAIPAEYKHKPKRAIIVIVIVMFAFTFHLIFILLKIYINNRKLIDEEFAHTLAEIRRLIRNK